MMRDLLLIFAVVIVYLFIGLMVVGFLEYR